MKSFFLQLWLLLWSGLLLAAPMEGELELAGGKKIAYRTSLSDCGPRKAVIIPGWSETYLQYDDLLQEFQKRKICTYIFDLPEQGLSYRSLEETRLSYVETFDVYVDAFDQFVQKVVKPEPQEKLTLLSHSTGGLVALHYIARAKTLPPFDKVVLSAPLIGVNTGWVPQSIAKTLASLSCWLGLEKSKVLSQGKWTKDANPFEGNKVSSSEARYKQFLSVYEKVPRTRIEGVSNRWVVEIFKATAEVPLFMQRINTPILLLQAEKDGFVSNAAQDEFCRMAQQCKKVTFPGARHGLLLESDEIRDSVLKNIFDWI